MRRDRCTASLFALVAVLAADALHAQVQGTLRVNQDRLLGTHPSGDILLYTPDPVQLGSSVSHWDTQATPNLLMEPFLTSDLPFLGLDVTTAQMQDIGWQPGTSTINVFPLDPPGTGFFDPTPFAGAPGNPAVTLGRARQNVFQAVLGAWGSVLGSPVDIDVAALWVSLPCEGGSAVLGSATTLSIFRDDGGVLPLPDVWFHAALAESLVGSDQNGPPMVDDEGQLTGGDILTFFNADLDEECLGPDTGWYYGLDGNEPPGKLDLAATLLHELGHGLGFSNFVDETDGLFFDGFPDIFSYFTFDRTLGLFWDEMTDTQRVFSARNPFQVTWGGEGTNAAAADLLAPGVPELEITAPGQIAGTYPVGLAAFGPPLPASGLTGEIACFEDGVADPTVLNGCTPAANPGELAGRIALIDRGQCDFVTKVANAQAAGAIAVIIANNAGDGLPGLGGVAPSITIPAISVGASDGARIRGQACSDAALSLTDSRFQVTAHWKTPTSEGEGKSVQLTPDTGYFWFFNPNNVELVVKVLDACTPFERFWVFAGGLTNVEVALTVVDAATGQTKQYTNPQETPFQPIQDTDAFATCP